MVRIEERSLEVALKESPTNVEKLSYSVGLDAISSQMKSLLTSLPQQYQIILSELQKR